MGRWRGHCTNYQRYHWVRIIEKRFRILTFSNDKIRPDKQQDIIAESNTAAKFINKARIDNVNVWTLEMMVSLSKVSWFCLSRFFILKLSLNVCGRYDDVLMRQDIIIVNSVMMGLLGANIDMIVTTIVISCVMIKYMSNSSVILQLHWWVRWDHGSPGADQ